MCAAYHLGLRCLRQACPLVQKAISSCELRGEAGEEHSLLSLQAGLRWENGRRGEMGIVFCHLPNKKLALGLRGVVSVAEPGIKFWLCVTLGKFHNPFVPQFPHFL